jgi:hypothetical protein
MKHILSLSIATTLIAARAAACDMCACDLPLVRLENHAGWYVGASEQYTSYERLRLDGRGIRNAENQYMHSSITQLYLGYDFTNRFGVQVNVPLIHRTYRRVEENVVESGDVSGLGDVSLLAHYSPLRVERGDFILTGRLVAGIKFPTGDSGRLAEEGGHGHAEEEEAGHGHEEAEHAGHEHEHEEEEIPSGVHGHDLALGSGSVDGIFGTDIYMQWKRIFLEAGVQITVRGDGDHDYDYADELSWRAGVGAVVWDKDDLHVALEARFSGETKGEDEFSGERLADTSATNIYLGPHVVATWRDRLSVRAGFDFPVSQENSGVQTTPEMRFQAAIGWQF